MIFRREDLWVKWGRHVIARSSGRGDLTDFDLTGEFYGRKGDRVAGWKYEPETYRRWFYESAATVQAALSMATPYGRLRTWDLKVVFQVGRSLKAWALNGQFKYDVRRRIVTIYLWEQELRSPEHALFVVGHEAGHMLQWIEDPNCLLAADRDAGLNAYIENEADELSLYLTPSLRPWFDGGGGRYNYDRYEPAAAAYRAGWRLDRVI